MKFEVGDIIYKKKYHGNVLLSDYNNKFVILNLYKIPLRNSDCNVVVALLDDNTEFEITDENMDYAEKVYCSIFCG